MTNRKIYNILKELILSEQFQRELYPEYEFTTIKLHGFKIKNYCNELKLAVEFYGVSHDKDIQKMRKDLLKERMCKNLGIKLIIVSSWAKVILKDYIIGKLDMDLIRRILIQKGNRIG